MIQNEPVSPFRASVALGIVSLLVEAVVFFLDMKEETLLRILHLAEMVVLIGIAFFYQLHAARSRSMDADHRRKWMRVSFWIRSGLVFSLAGDFINSKLFDFTFILKPQTLLSILPFAAAHIYYIRSFIFVSNDTEATAKKRLIATMLVWPLIAFPLWYFLMGRTAQGIMLYLSLPYALLVTLMALFSIHVSSSRGSLAFPVTAGGFLFLLSDSLIAYSLVNEPSALRSQAIWITYILAQILITGTMRLAFERAVLN